jgi:outer membrane receptor for ferrienterochelin and colicins
MNIIAFIILLNFIFPQKIDGYLLDKDSGNPISDVELIQVSNGEIITKSNLDGQFLIILNNDNDSVRFNHIAYKNTTLHSININNKVYLEKDLLYADVVEITSSRKETRLSDSPTLTYVISEKDLESIAAIDFYQSLQMIIPNIMFSPDFHGTNLKIQGLDSEYILILVDGDRIAGNTVGNIDFSKFNVDQIQRIEVLKGNASTLYGSNAIGGVINIITKPIENQKNKFSINSKYGNFNTFNNSLSLNTTFNKIASRTNFLIKSSDGYKLESVETDTLRKRKFKDYNFSQKFKYTKNDFMVELSGNYYKHDWYRFLQTQPYEQPERNHRKQYESFSIKLKEKNHLSSINGHYNFSYTFDQYKKYHVIDRDYTTNNDDILYDWTNHSVEQISSLLYLFKNQLNLTLGLDIINEKGESNDIIIDDILILESELGDLSSKTFNTYALFFQSQFTFSENLNVFFGTRYTAHNEFDNMFTSQLTTKYSLGDNHFRLNTGQGYRVPNIYELYYDWQHYDEFEIKGNPLLKPENSLNINLSYQKLSKKWKFMVILERNMIDNMIAEKRYENGDFYYENYDKTSVNSFESNFGLEINNINYDLSYNFSRVIDEIEYNRLPEISEHIINFNFSKIFKNNITILGNLNYYSDKVITAPTSRIPTFIPSYHQFNISFIKKDIKFLKDANFKFAISNLFDYTNFDDTTFQNPGRTFFIEVNYDYDFK